MQQSAEYNKYLDVLSIAERQVAPKELYYEGDFGLLLKSPKVSVVGSRNISPEGEKRANLNGLIENRLHKGIYY